MTKGKVDESQVLGKLLVEQHGDFLRKLLKSALTQVMEAEVAERCGAGPGERSMDRVNRRNGYRDRDLETRLGTVELAIPRLRQGSYFPTFLEPRRRWEKAFVSVVAESYVLGVSTRKVDELVKAFGAQGMTRCTSRSARVSVWCPRPSLWPTAWLRTGNGMSWAARWQPARWRTPGGIS